MMNTLSSVYNIYTIHKEEERRRNLLSDDSQPLCGGFSYGRTFSTKSGKIAFLSLFIGGEY